MIKRAGVFSACALTFFSLSSNLAFGAQTLSLQDCISRAERFSPQAIIGLLKEAHSHFTAQAAKDAILPQASAVGSYQQSNSQSIQAIDINQAALSLSQNISPFSPQWVLVRQKKADYRAAQAEHIATEEDVELQVKILYLSILKEKDYLKRFRRLEKKLSNMKKALIPRYSVGRVPPFDLVKIEMALSALAKNQEFTEAQLAADKESLALITGFKDGNGIDLKKLTHTPPLLFDAASFGENTNPRLLALKRRLESSRLAVKAAEYERYPSLNAGLNYGYEGSDGFFNFIPNTSFPNNIYGLPLESGWNASLSLNLPIWDWGIISSHIAQRKEEAAITRSRLNLEKQALQVQFIKWEKLAQTHLADKKRMDDLLPQTQEAAKVQTRRYRLGASGILEAADALNIWLNTLLSERDDYYSYLSDLAQIEHLMGQNTVDYE